MFRVPLLDAAEREQHIGGASHAGPYSHARFDSTKVSYRATKKHCGQCSAARNYTGASPETHFRTLVATSGRMVEGDNADPYRNAITLGRGRMDLLLGPGPIDVV